MAFYSACYRDPRNRLAHFAGVPMIMFSRLVTLSLAGLTVGGATITGAVALAAAGGCKPSGCGTACRGAAARRRRPQTPAHASGARSSSGSSTGQTLSRSTGWAAAVGWMPSSCIRSGLVATPAMKKGTSAASYSNASSG